MKVAVRYRDLENEGLVTEEIEAFTCEDIVDYVTSKLSPSWPALFKKNPEFVIYGTRPGRAAIIKELDDLVEMKMMYNVYESGDFLPCEVYRSCPPDNSPCVFAKVSERSPFTKVCPLALATFKATEAEMPHFSAMEQGEVIFHGLSVSIFNNATKLEDTELKDPLRDITSDGTERAGYTFMTPEQFEKVAEEKDRPPPFGILKTSLTHPKGCLKQKKGVVEKRKPKKNKSNQPDGQVWKREVNWIWTLKALLNLRELGFRFIFDNRGERGHITLVRIFENNNDCDWVVAYNHVRNGPYVPQAAAKLLQEGKTDLDVVLEGEGFKYIPGKEPEIMTIPIFSIDYEDIACPKLAQCFKLYGMTMRSRTEPKAPEEFLNEEQLQFYTAIIELFHQTHDPEVLRVIDEVEKKEYRLKALSKAERDVLDEGFKDAMWDLEEAGDDNCEEECETLDMGWNLLGE